MTDNVYYTRRESHFVSFPAENYVDYMTYVMAIPERHQFYIPSKSVMIVCEVSTSCNDRVLRWRKEWFDELPMDKELIEMDEKTINSIIEKLNKNAGSTTCKVCENFLRKFLRFF
jgi:hypothetical protein